MLLTSLVLVKESQRGTRERGAVCGVLAPRSAGTEPLEGWVTCMHFTHTQERRIKNGSLKLHFSITVDSVLLVSGVQPDTPYNTPP